jgi:hypothetical protein
MILARKVLKSEGKLLKNMTDLMDQFIGQQQSSGTLKSYQERNWKNKDNPLKLPLFPLGCAWLSLQSFWSMTTIVA